jgi:RNA recognition motif-containing protein
MKLYVGNLSYQCREQDLEELFSQFGTVSSVNVISDKFTGRSKGFAFIEFDNDDEANRAIEELHETEFMQRNLIVNEARPREDRPQRSFDRNRGGGGGGGDRDRDRGGYRR